MTFMYSFFSDLIPIITKLGLGNIYKRFCKMHVQPNFAIVFRIFVKLILKSLTFFQPISNKHSGRNIASFGFTCCGLCCNFVL
jgi:hypothetical protein